MLGGFSSNFSYNSDIKPLLNSCNLFKLLNNLGNPGIN